MFMIGPGNFSWQENEGWIKIKTLLYLASIKAQKLIMYARAFTDIIYMMAESTGFFHWYFIDK